MTNNLLINFNSFMKKNKQNISIKLARSSLILSLPIFAITNIEKLANSRVVEETVEVLEEDISVEIIENISISTVTRSYENTKKDFSSLPDLSKVNSSNVYYHYANSYSCSEEELTTIMKVVSKEAGGSTYEDLYIDAMAVMSVALNRIEDVRWSYLGETPIEQLSASDQFIAYESALSLNEDEIPAAVRDAVIDSLNGIRNNKYVSYRAKENKKTGRIQLVDGGNNYFDVMEPIEEIENNYYLKNK